jgi:hypothetical protein
MRSSRRRRYKGPRQFPFYDDVDEIIINDLTVYEPENEEEWTGLFDANGQKINRYTRDPVGFLWDQFEEEEE